MDVQLTLKKAQNIAHDLMDELKPHCNIVVVAGSVRRLKRYPKDLELVCIPKTEPTGQLSFFEPPKVKPVKGFMEVINKYEKIKGEPKGKYTQRLVEGIKLDLFIANEINIGYIHTIRTGSNNFSIRLASAGAG
jgi:DNA polymerase/3'-5' exonuclease PolX